MNKKIVWQKWADPFNENPDLDLTDKEEEPAYKDSYQIAEDLRNPRKGYNGPLIVGPMGVIPLNEHNIPSKVYCFWMGHTNFDITKPVAQKISEVPGVEALDVFTRYRFRVAFGKAFLNEEKDPFGREIMRAIEEAICKEAIVQVQVTESVKNLNLTLIKKHLKSKYGFWAITECNGTLDTYGAATKEEVIAEIAKHPTNNLVATSWE